MTTIELYNSDEANEKPFETINKMDGNIWVLGEDEMVLLMYKCRHNFVPFCVYHVTGIVTNDEDIEVYVGRC